MPIYLGMNLEEKRKQHAAYMRNLKERNPYYVIYDVWRLMLRRCYDPKHKNYNRYGARGIEICEEWKDAKTFIAWALDGWKPGLQIDRIDNNGNYSPANCRWTTSRQNNRNRSSNKLTEQSVAEIRARLSSGEKALHLAREFGVHHALIYRIKYRKIWV